MAAIVAAIEGAMHAPVLAEFGYAMSPFNMHGEEGYALHAIGKCPYVLGDRFDFPPLPAAVVQGKGGWKQGELLKRHQYAEACRAGKGGSKEAVYAQVCCQVLPPSLAHLHGRSGALHLVSSGVLSLAYSLCVPPCMDVDYAASVHGCIVYSRSSRWMVLFRLQQLPML